MKIRLSKNSLSLIINRIQGSISDKNLAQIGLKAEKGVVTLLALDKVITVYSSLQCDIEEEGIVFLSARIFSDVVRELPNTIITISKSESDNKKVIISTPKESGSFNFKIAAIDDSEWREKPDIGDIDHHKLNVKAEKLLYMIEQTQHCVSPDSPRFYGSVAYLHKIDEKLRFVASDGYRLSFCETKVENNIDFLNEGICFTNRALQELNRICSESIDEVELIISNDRTVLIASIPGYLAIIRLSVVKYPNYFKSLPGNLSNQICLQKNNFQSVMRRVLLAADKSKILCILINKNQVVLTSETLGSSESKEIISIDDSGCNNFKVILNGKLLTDIFSIIQKDTVKISFDMKNVNLPILITAEQEPYDCDSKHILVPITG